MQEMKYFEFYKMHGDDKFNMILYVAGCLKCISRKGNDGKTCCMHISVQSFHQALFCYFVQNYSFIGMNKRSVAIHEREISYILAYKSC